MPRAARRRVLGLLAVLALALMTQARADNEPPTAAIGNPDAARLPLPPRGPSGQRASASARTSGGWWLGSAGIALALAVFGAVSLASRRYLPQHGSGPLRVVGRTSLTPKHTVYLLKAGDRVLLVGTGPQGAPSLLGELTDPNELERLQPRPAARFDQRVGDDA